MKVLAVHPSGLMYSKIFLRLEPIGLELVCAALKKGGHDVQLFDLQVERKEKLFKLAQKWQPVAIAFSCNYLANIPEIIDLAKSIKEILPSCFIFVGGHSASFVFQELLDHSEGAIDCVLKGEGEVGAVELVNSIERDKGNLLHVHGIVLRDGVGPPPVFVETLDELSPDRSLLRKPRSYYIGVLDPCASIEFSRGCPWNCSFCSAWTFYGRSYRQVSPQVAAERLMQIKEPGVFIVDDVAFIQGEHGMAIGEEIARRGIKKRYYLETRCDVLLRNKEVFRLWKKLGLEYMFLGLEAIDAEALNSYRKRVSLDQNFEALEFARSLGIMVSINLIVDPSWDRERFKVVRNWAQEVPEIVNLTVLTPYPGTETWYSETRQLTTRDYRLFDIQHSVLPTALPLEEFYRELVRTQAIIYQKFLGLHGFLIAAPVFLGNLLHGSTNLFRFLTQFPKVYNHRLQMNDHLQTVKYELHLPPANPIKISPEKLYIHPVKSHKNRIPDEESERFIEQTRSNQPS